MRSAIATLTTETTLMEILEGAGLRISKETPEQRAERERREADDRAAQARAEAADRRESDRRILISCGVAERHANAIVLGPLQETEAVRRVRLWLEQDRLALVLAGPPDAGKTTAASLAIHHDLQRWLLRMGKKRPAPVRIKVRHLAKAWMYKPNEYSPSPVDPVTGMTQTLLLTCSLLVLDDVGQGPAGLASITDEAVEAIIDGRCDDGLRTVITTNYTTQRALFERLGPHAQFVRERLTEYGFWADCPVVGLRRASRVRGEETTT